VTIDNHDLSGVVNGANATFNGEGVAFILQDTATLTGFIQRSTINNNADDGIRIDVSGTSVPTDFASVNDFVIGGVTADLGNTIQQNGNNGIEVNRTTNGEVNNMQIYNNTIQTNSANGIRLVASNEPNQDTYFINNNKVSTNGLDGIQLRVEADASINAMIDLNTITGNGTAGNPLFGSGIHTLEQANSANDGRFVAGFWTRNTITGNNLDGIDLDSSMTTLVIGDPVDTTLGNFISANNRNGINVEGPTGTGEVVIGSNVISLNGTVGTVGTANETAGIMANVRPDSNVTIINNQIVNNHGDGIQYGINRNYIGFGQLQVISNNVAFNDGRGLDILNLGDDFIQVTVDGNVFNRNLLEGVYVVNTSSRNQNQFNASTMDLLADGSVFRDPIIEMQFTNNQVIGNGYGTSAYPSGPASATGLVVRVGTSTSLSSTNPGGFASDGGPVALGASPFGTSSGLGGVTMTVDNNVFTGNFGDDLMFASFVSTVTPNGGTAWDLGAAPPTFDTNGYQSDPLARLDLYFRNNTYDGQGTTTATGINNYNGVTGDNGHVVNQSTAAYYNNADDTFKSRNGKNNNDPTQSGPFDNPSRRRNAQRQASRSIVGFTNPNNPVGASFLFPGLGESTFRVSADSDTTDFLLDSEPVTSQADWNGFFLPPPNSFGEAPFGWGTF
jgi:ACT domain-containing protein